MRMSSLFSLLTLTTKPCVATHASTRDIQPETLNSTTLVTCDPCEVCCAHHSRYTCPKCNIRYCSVVCYREHGECTEDFYRNRSHQILNLEAKDLRDETEFMLHRLQSNTPALLDDHLYDLLLAIENDDHPRIERLLASHDIKRNIEHDMPSLREWILHPWHPWWEPQLGFLENGQDQDTDRINGKSLDEYILCIPPFHGLRPKKALPDLSFNVMDILYGIAWTVRLYHGPRNAQDIPDEAVRTLLEGSAVLGNNQNFLDTSETLNRCVERSSEAGRRGRCNSSWEVLVMDVFRISQKFRFMARCFLEAIELVKAYKKSARNEEKRHIRRIQKKLEFYISWIKEHSFDQAISSEIKNWMETWPDDGVGRLGVLPSITLNVPRKT